MPLRALRLNGSDRDLNRRSTVEPGSGFGKRSDRGRSADNLNGSRLAVSTDASRPPQEDDAGRPSTSHDDSALESPPIQEPTPNTRRFSLMRFRYASDSQLSLTAKDSVPPVPPVPALPAHVDPPAIITTAPTVVIPPTPSPGRESHRDQSPPKKKGRLQQFALRRRSLDPSTFDRPANLRQSMEKMRRPLALKRSFNNLAEERERRSTSRTRPEALADARPSGESALSLAPPAARASESSRSDGSSTGHVSFENAYPHRPQPPTRLGSGRFTFGRRKQRAPLFPLPPKVEPPQFPDTAPTTPRVSTSGVSSSSPRHSPSGSPPLTALRVEDEASGTQTPPVPSSSQLALAASSLNFAAPASVALFRTESTRSIPRSIRSARSSPNVNAPSRLGQRGRSSTMGSIDARSDGATSPTPPNGLIGRDSTSTAGRSSFSNLFGLSSRFRQNSEPHSPRYGSPAHGFLGSSGLSSHQNSFTISRETFVLPEREEGETPGHYLERIEANDVDKSVIASYLSKTDDAFLLSVLRSYMRRFAFFGDPIDMAIRKLLMQVELPKETQQIDRVLQGFADRYHECNPGIYTNTDTAYFVSFSIIILHTDVFNKNNKRKMQRPDYIKNSSCEGVSSEVLGCFYDNIAYTPFIHIEDEVDLKNISSKKSKRTAVLKGPMNDTAKKVNKEPIDPYTLIFEGKLDLLRPNIKDVMNLDDPYNYIGTTASLDTKNIYKQFSKYGVIQIVSSRSRPEAFMSEAAQENPLQTSVGIVEMPVTKVGILWRKDAKRKKARSPWQEWGAILTRSGLSLFRNHSWAKNLMNQHDHHQKRNEAGPVMFHPPLENFKQDHMIPMDGAVALIDNTYRKHKYGFVVFTKAGEETFLADNEKELNEWLRLLNYTAAFETLGVRSRGMAGGIYEGQRSKITYVPESSQSAQATSSTAGDGASPSENAEEQFAQQMMNARKELMQIRIAESEEKLVEAIKGLEDRLRDARHLQILAPIQPKTREYVIHAAGRLSAKLKWSRIEIWRMKCHRDILAQELEDENKSFSDKQARTDQTADSSQAQQAQASPQQVHRGSKISGLARLASKTSSLTSGQKPPLSPGSSMARPGTKSSKDTDFGGEDAFKTPPETSRQSSPNDPAGQFHVVPMALNPPASDRRSSIASSSARSPSLVPRSDRPSVSTAGGTADSESDSDDDSRYTTPPAESETAGPRTPEIQPMDGSPWSPNAESENDQTLANLAGSPASRNKHRRSLHRTLRDSHGSSHRRSLKAKDPSAISGNTDGQENERLTRGKGSFTVHGKKASVINFGSDWHNTTAEERLKTKRQLQEAQEANSSNDRDGNNGGINIRTSALLSPGTDYSEELTPRKTSVDALKQRHVSSQTITPANFRDSFQGDSHSENASDMSDIAEESPTKTTDQALKKQKQKQKESSDPGQTSVVQRIPGT